MKGIGWTSFCVVTIIAEIIVLFLFIRVSFYSDWDFLLIVSLELLLATTVNGFIACLFLIIDEIFERS